MKLSDLRQAETSNVYSEAMTVYSEDAESTSEAAVKFVSDFLEAELQSFGFDTEIVVVSPASNSGSSYSAYRQVKCICSLKDVVIGSFCAVVQCNKYTKPYAVRVHFGVYDEDGIALNSDELRVTISAKGHKAFRAAFK